MANKKIRMRPEGTNDYTDILHPETSADQVKIVDSGNKFVATDVEGALSELFQNVSDGKTTVASAITGIGQSASGSDTFATLAGKINAVPRKTAQTFTPSTANQTISSGQYLSGVQTILGDSDLASANIKAGINIFGVDGKASVVNTEDATAGLADILSGKIAYVNGIRAVGTIPSKAAETITPGTANKTIAAGQYLSGLQTILGDPDLIASNILSGKNIFGVAGNVISGAGMKNFATGTATTVNGGLAVTGLSFSPSYAMFWSIADNGGYYVYGMLSSKPEMGQKFSIGTYKLQYCLTFRYENGNYRTYMNGYETSPMTANGFSISIDNGKSVRWIAVE